MSDPPTPFGPDDALSRAIVAWRVEETGRVILLVDGRAVASRSAEETFVLVEAGRHCATHAQRIAGSLPPALRSYLDALPVRYTPPPPEER